MKQQQNDGFVDVQLINNSYVKQQQNDGFVDVHFVDISSKVTEKYFLTSNNYFTSIK